MKLANLAFLGFSAVLGVGGFVYLNRQPAAPTPTPSPTPTADLVQDGELPTADALIGEPVPNWPGYWPSSGRERTDTGPTSPLGSRL